MAGFFFSHVPYFSRRPPSHAPHRLLAAALIAAYDLAVVRPLAREGALPLGRAKLPCSPSFLIPALDRAAVQRATW